MRGKKRRVYLITQVDRETRCIIAYDEAYDREPERLQALLNTAPLARHNYADQLATYTNLVYYPGHHTALPNKSQTYSVVGGNAELRHYLGRLVRRSRCYTRSLRALRDAVKLFVYAWNRRQLFRHAHPKYPPMCFSSPTRLHSHSLHTYGLAHGVALCYYCIK